MNCDQSEPPIFDGHNDVLLRLLRSYPDSAAEAFIQGDGKGHLDLPRCRQAGFVGGLFSLYVPSLSSSSVSFEKMKGEYHLPLPPEEPLAESLQFVMREMSLIRELESRSTDRIRVCTNVMQIESCMAKNQLAIVMHMEGAEAIDSDLHNLQVLYDAGLRSLGPVWSRPTRFGHGVPFAFPHSPDTGDGLTTEGKNLIRRLNELGMLIDLSHLNEKGFDDVASLSTAPLVATHSNAWTLSNSSRNLTDRQLRVIRDSEGLVGLNFATSFLRPDGKMLTRTPLSHMLEHLDYLIEFLGEDGVALGSDFDGAAVPEDIGDVTGLSTLRSAMQTHGYDASLMEKLCYKNWLSVLQRTLKD